MSALPKPWPLDDCETIMLPMKADFWWPEIKKAEGNSKESQLAYDNLKAEFVDKFWNNSISFENSAKEINPLS